MAKQGQICCCYAAFICYISYMNELIDRFLITPSRGYFLFGPRGTGKSTWLKMQYPDAKWIDLLSQSAYQSYLANPDRLRDFVRGAEKESVVVIDEIQRVPALLNVVHQLIEEKKGLQFVLTGSSARKLRRSGVDLLAGRVSLTTCHPYMASELKERFSLVEALNFGLVPLIYEAKERQEVLNAYMELYLREEVQAEGLVRNIASFARFLEAISFSHASLLNLAEVARECEVSRKTVEGYVSILNDLLIAHLLPIFSKRAKRQLVKHNKFYFFDAGVFRAIRPKGPLDNPSEIDGMALEGLVFQHLLAWKSYSKERINLYFWRTRAGNEVDFVIYGESVFYAIEVKNSRKAHRSDLRSLRSFGEDYPEAQLIMLYRGTEKLMIGNVHCIPCDEFLRTLNPDNWSLI